MTDLDEIIEYNKGPELEVFERAIEKLTQEQLEDINVEIGIYTAEDAKGQDRDFLEITAAETSWSKFFAAHRKVVGRPFELDSDE